MASDLYPQEGIDKEFSELGQSRDCQENETKFKIRLFVCEYWEFVLDWVSDYDASS